MQGSKGNYNAAKQTINNKEPQASIVYEVLRGERVKSISSIFAKICLDSLVSL